MHVYSQEYDDYVYRSFFSDITNIKKSYLQLQCILISKIVGENANNEINDWVFSITFYSKHESLFLAHIFTGIW